MNKADLKEKWGKYCGTDKLVDDVMQLLTANNHTNTEHGVCCLLDKYFTNKESLIGLFITSNHYDGALRIVTKQSFDRQPSQREIRTFLCDNRFGEIQLLQQKDDQGKTMHDYLRTGKKKVTLDDLPKAKDNSPITKFDYYDGHTKESREKYDSFVRYLNAFRNMGYTTLQRDICDSDYDGAPMLKMGTKTSRAFNKVCQHYGIDKLNAKMVDGKTIYPYNKIFAEYADLVSGLSRQMYFVISINPLDYLQMSYGISWHSCHNIVNGQWKGGCLSYMLDKVSMVSFVIDKVDAPIHEKPRYYRQMFHYDDNMFMQNRLYPKENDGATDLYGKFRNLVIEEFSEMLDMNGEWMTEKGTCGDHTESIGAHYVDYRANPSCAIFYPKSHANTTYNRKMTVGSKGICVKCGQEWTSCGRLNHNTWCHP